MFVIYVLCLYSLYYFESVFLFGFDVKLGMFLVRGRDYNYFFLLLFVELERKEYKVLFFKIGLCFGILFWRRVVRFWLIVFLVRMFCKIK